MSIRTSDPDRFFDLLAEAIPWFVFFGCSNYVNSCSLSVATWLLWKEQKHPIVSWLRNHFKATSEEYGETAIHTMCSHLNENNYSGEVMAQRWTDTAIAMEIFEAFDIKPSHKSSVAKRFSKKKPNEVYFAIHQAYVKVLQQGQDPSYSCFCKRSKSGYTSESTREVCQGAWNERFDDDVLKKYKESALKRASVLHKKLSKLVKDPSYDTVDMDFAW